jgi:hypothetical protein
MNITHHNATPAYSYTSDLMFVDVLLSYFTPTFPNSHLLF